MRKGYSQVHWYYDFDLLGKRAHVTVSLSPVILFVTPVAVLADMAGLAFCTSHHSAIIWVAD